MGGQTSSAQQRLQQPRPATPSLLPSRNPSPRMAAGPGPVPGWRGSPAAGYELLRSRNRRGPPLTPPSATASICARQCAVGFARQCEPQLLTALPPASLQRWTIQFRILVQAGETPERVVLQPALLHASPAPRPGGERSLQIDVAAVISRWWRREAARLRRRNGPRPGDTDQSLPWPASGSRRPARQPVYGCSTSAQRHVATPRQLRRLPRAPISRHQRCVSPDPAPSAAISQRLSRAAPARNSTAIRAIPRRFLRCCAAGLFADAQPLLYGSLDGSGLVLCILMSRPPFLGPGGPALAVLACRPLLCCSGAAGTPQGRADRHQRWLLLPAGGGVWIRLLAGSHAAPRA